MMVTMAFNELSKLYFPRRFADQSVIYTFLKSLVHFGPMTPFDVFRGCKKETRAWDGLKNFGKIIH